MAASKVLSRLLGEKYVILIYLMLYGLDFVECSLGGDEFVYAFKRSFYCVYLSQVSVLTR